MNKINCWQPSDIVGRGDAIYSRDQKLTFT